MKYENRATAQLHFLFFACQVFKVISFECCFLQSNRRSWADRPAVFGLREDSKHIRGKSHSSSLYSRVLDKSDDIDCSTSSYDGHEEIIHRNTIRLNLDLNYLSSNFGGRGVVKASEMLKGAEERYQESKNIYPASGQETAIPDVVSFTTLIDAYAQSGMASSAQELLDYMEKVSHEEGTVRLMPNTVTYNAVMNSYARSTDEDAPQQVEDILSRLEKSSKNIPDATSYNICLNAWSRS